MKTHKPIGSYAERLTLPRIQQLVVSAMNDPSDLYEKIIGESFLHHPTLNESFGNLPEVSF
jgi:hypothetical protein